MIEKPRPALTPAQRKTLEAVNDYRITYGTVPTQRELADLVGLASTNSVRKHIAKLEEKGYLRPGVMRGIKL